MTTANGSNRRRRGPHRGLGWLAWLPMLALGLGMAMGTTGCLERWTQGRRQPGSALWVSPQTPSLNSFELSGLRKSGLQEIFIEVAELTWEGDRPRFEPKRRVGLPRNMPVTLVVTGRWKKSDLEPEDVAREIASGLMELKLDSESNGLLPSGFHFDLDAGQFLANYAEVLDQIQRKTSRLQISATVAWQWLDDSAVADLAANVHFLVCFVYGQKMAEAEESEFWDLDAVQATLTKLDALNRDYLVGIRTLGSISKLARGGERLAVAPGGQLQDLLKNSALSIKAAFAFEGFNRQIFDFEADGYTEAGDWTLKAGERLHVARPTSYHLRKLEARIDSMGLGHRLGNIYYRPVTSEEDLSMSLENLANSVSGMILAPRLTFEVEVVSQSSRQLVLAITLRNLGTETTSVASVDHNFVEARAHGALFSKVALGDFKRLELRRSDSAEINMQALRAADSLRLFYPLMDGGWVVTSGRVELSLTGDEPRIELTAHYLLPDGRELDTPPQTWPPPPGPAEDGEDTEGSG